MKTLRLKKLTILDGSEAEKIVGAGTTVGITGDMSKYSVVCCQGGGTDGTLCCAPPPPKPPTSEVASACC